MIKRGSKRKDEVILIQRFLNATNFCMPHLSVDGIFGKDTEQCVKAFQKHVGLVSDGIVGFKTLLALLSYKPIEPRDLRKEVKKFLSDGDYEDAAENLGVEVAVMKAVTEVESLGSGFIEDKPKILFEGHVFWERLTIQGFDPTQLREGNEDILYMKWTSRYYKGGLAEYDRLEKAKEIHTPSALESCSWGMFQIMGYHWRKLKYPSIAHFVYDMRLNEGAHLKAFTRYCVVYQLVNYLKEKDFESFARAYNGAGYEKNNYHVKLKKAYEKHRREL